MPVNFGLLQATPPEKAQITMGPLPNNYAAQNMIAGFQAANTAANDSARTQVMQDEDKRQQAMLPGMLEQQKATNQSLQANAQMDSIKAQVTQQEYAFHQQDMKAAQQGGMKGYVGSLMKHDPNAAVATMQNYQQWQNNVYQGKNTLLDLESKKASMGVTQLANAGQLMFKVSQGSNGDPAKLRQNYNDIYSTLKRVDPNAPDPSKISDSQLHGYIAGTMGMAIDISHQISSNPILGKYLYPTSSQQSSNNPQPTQSNATSQQTSQSPSQQPNNGLTQAEQDTNDYYKRQSMLEGMKEEAKAHADTNENVAKTVLTQTGQAASNANDMLPKLDQLDKLADSVKGKITPKFQFDLQTKKLLSAVTGKDVKDLAPMEAIDQASKSLQVGAVSALQHARATPGMLNLIQGSIANPSSSYAGFKKVVDASRLTANLSIAHDQFMQAWHDSNNTMTGAEEQWANYQENITSKMQNKDGSFNYKLLKKTGWTSYLDPNYTVPKEESQPTNNSASTTVNPIETILQSRQGK